MKTKHNKHIPAHASDRNNEWTAALLVEGSVPAIQNTYMELSLRLPLDLQKTWLNLYAYIYACAGVNEHANKTAIWNKAWHFGFTAPIDMKK